MHPLMRAAGHRLVTPTYTGLGERVHLANPSIDLDSHIEDILNVIKYEDLRDIVLVGHSYGGMVATGVADRARDITQLIYVDAFVPEDGQSLFDLNQAARPRMLELAQSSTAGAFRRCRRRRTPRLKTSNGWLHAARRCRSNVSTQSLSCKAADRDAAAQLHLRHSLSAGRHVRSVCRRKQGAIRRGAISRSTPATRRTSPRRKRCWRCWGRSWRKQGGCGRPGTPLATD